MSRIKIYKSDIKFHKHKYNPSSRYKDIIGQTNKRIREHQRESDLTYKKASKCFAWD